MATGAGSPCGACKFLRRKCALECIFAPYFSSEQGPARFAAIHKIFGASNVSKLLSHVPVPDRCEAVVTIAYEAEARIGDPVYGCVAHIIQLQQQVAALQAELMQVKAQLAYSMVRSQKMENHLQGNTMDSRLYTYPYAHFLSPQNSLDSIDQSSDGPPTQEVCFKDDFPTQLCTKRKASRSELGELQALALRMMRN